MGYSDVKSITDKYQATLVAVSKTKPESAILVMYNNGHRDFGENRVQELVDKEETLPKDIRWHMIGHLQKNKVKYIAPFVHLIHSVDSTKLLKTIIKEARKNERCIDVLLQLKIAQEETKYGLEEQELIDIATGDEFCTSPHIQIRGIMAMASFVNDPNQLTTEFNKAKRVFELVKARELSSLGKFDTLSMGMSGDFELAMECGSNMVRVGSLIFGPR